MAGNACTWSIICSIQVLRYSFDFIPVSPNVNDFPLILSFYLRSVFVVLCFIWFCLVFKRYNEVNAIEYQWSDLPDLASNSGNNGRLNEHDQRQEKGIRTRVVRGPLPGSLLPEGSHQVVLRLFSHQSPVYDCHYTHTVVPSGKSSWKIAKNPQESY